MSVVRVVPAGRRQFPFTTCLVDRLSSRSLGQLFRWRTKQLVSVSSLKNCDKTNRIQRGDRLQGTSAEDAQHKGPIAPDVNNHNHTRLGWVSRGLFFKDEHDRSILALAVPALIALAADPLLSLVDTAFVGHLGPDALGALGVNTALFTFAFVVFNFLATATTPLLASALATGDKEQAGRVTLQATILAALLGSCITASLLAAPGTFLTLLGAGQDTGHMHELALEYLQYRAVSAPAVLLMTVGQGVFRGVNDTRTPLAITVAANVVNLSLDVVLIPGTGWGVAGAAVATTTAEWMAAVAYGALIWKDREKIGLVPLPTRGLFDLHSHLLPFVTAGSAVLARTALLLATKTIASATAARLGAVPISAHQILSQLWMLSSMMIDSLAVAAQTLVAVAVASGDTATARRIADRLLQFGLYLAGGLMVLFVCAAPFIPLIFGNDAEVNAAVFGLMPLAVMMLPINSVVYVLDGVLAGAADFKFLAGAMVFSATSSLVLLLGVQPLDLGLEGVWGALALLMSSRMVTLLWRYNSDSGPVPPGSSVLQDIPRKADPVERRLTETDTATPLHLLKQSLGETPSGLRDWSKAEGTGERTSIGQNGVGRGTVPQTAVGLPPAVHNGVLHNKQGHQAVVHNGYAVNARHVDDVIPHQQDLADEHKSEVEHNKKSNIGQRMYIRKIVRKRHKSGSQSGNKDGPCDAAVGAHVDVKFAGCGVCGSARSLQGPKVVASGKLHVDQLCSCGWDASVRGEAMGCSCRQGSGALGDSVSRLGNEPHASEETT